MASKQENALLNRNFISKKITTGNRATLKIMAKSKGTIKGLRMYTAKTNNIINKRLLVLSEIKLLFIMVIGVNTNKQN